MSNNPKKPTNPPNLNPAVFETQESNPKLSFDKIFPLNDPKMSFQTPLTKIPETKPAAVPPRRPNPPTVGIRNSF